MKKIVYIFALFALTTATACTPGTGGANQEQFQQSGPGIKEQVKNGAFVVDVRTPLEFSAGSLPGAVNIPLNEVGSRINEFQGKSSVIVFCRSGKRSGTAKKILEENGIKNVTNGINVRNMEKELK